MEKYIDLDWEFSAPHWIDFTLEEDKNADKWFDEINKNMNLLFDQNNSSPNLTPKPRTSKLPIKRVFKITRAKSAVIDNFQEKNSSIISKDCIIKESKKKIRPPTIFVH